MRDRDNICQTKVIDIDGHVESCHQPTIGIITIRDEHGRPNIYPVCAECKTAAMEGIDDA